jgi:organic radical activating enzyme
VKPIAIEYVDPRRYDAVYIDWTLGNFCNFKCSYCPDNLHDNSHPMADIEIVKNFVKRVFEHYTKNLDKKYFVFNLMGGEPTLWKSIEPFIIWVKQYSQDLGIVSYIEILTNASRTLRWWNDYIKYFDFVKITHHAEFADPIHTASVADLAIENGIHSTVQVTMIPSLWDQCLSHLDQIKKSNYKFQIDVKPLRVNFGSTLYPYTTEQFDFFKKPFRKSDITKPLSGSVGMKSKFLFLDKSEQEIRYQDLITNKQNSWIGWKCWAGLDILTIRSDGSLRFGGACLMSDTGFFDKKITDDNIVFRTDPIICNQQWCSCGPDMETRKLNEN